MGGDEWKDTWVATIERCAKCGLYHTGVCIETSEEILLKLLRAYREDKTYPVGVRPTHNDAWQAMWMAERLGEMNLTIEPA